MCTTTVQNCCCGCSLKTGTSILLILMTLSSVFQLFAAFSGPGDVRLLPALASVIVLFICVVGFGGIEEEKPEHVLPFAILQFLIAISSAFGAIIPIVASRETRDRLIEAAQEGMWYTSEGLMALKETYNSITVCMSFVAALHYYFFVVVYSLYKKLQEDQRSPVVTHP